MKKTDVKSTAIAILLAMMMAAPFAIASAGDGFSEPGNGPNNEPPALTYCSYCGNAAANIGGDGEYINVNLPETPFANVGAGQAGGDTGRIILSPTAFLALLMISFCILFFLLTLTLLWKLRKDIEKGGEC